MQESLCDFCLFTAPCKPCKDCDRRACDECVAKCSTCFGWLCPGDLLRCDRCQGYNRLSGKDSDQDLTLRNLSCLACLTDVTRLRCAAYNFTGAVCRVCLPKCGLCYAPTIQCLNPDVW